MLRDRVSERRAARRARALRGDTGQPRAQDAALRGRGLGERGRRLLRDHRGAHARSRPSRRGPDAAPARRRAVGRAERHRGAVSDRRQPARHRGRAHECHRLAPVQGTDRRGQVRGGVGDRAGPGPRRRPGGRHLPGQSRPRRDGGHGALHGLHHPQGEGPAHDRLDRRGGDRAGAPAMPGQGHRQLRQPRGRGRALRARRSLAQDVWRGGGRRLHRRGQAAGHGGDAPEKARHRRALPRAAHRQVRAPPARPDLRRPRLPGGHGRCELRGLGRRDHRGHPGHQGALPRVPDDPRHLERLLRAAAGGPRGAQRRLPLPLHQGGARLRHRQQRADRALRLPLRGGAASVRGLDLHARRRSRRRLRRSLPGPHEGRQGGPRGAAARRAAGALHRRGVQGRTDRRPRAEARRSGAARHHQRPPDEGHGGGRPALQRQSAHRGGGAAIRRGDEGGGGLPRGLHGQGHERHARQHGARHRQGRRARHRQEPGRNHSREQRLSHHQPGHQGPSGGPDRGLPRPQTGRLRAVRACS